MENFLKGIGVAVLAVLGIALIATLFAYPTMWAMNYLFNPAFLATIFNTGHIHFTQALVINFLTGWLVKSRISTKK